MSRISFFRAKNAMLIANYISNAIGVAVVIVLSRGMGQIFSPEVIPHGYRISCLFVPFTFIVSTILVLIYEKPIRSYLNGLRDHKSFTEKATLSARKKVLNEPFFLIAISCTMWLAAAAVYSVSFWTWGAPREMIREVFFQNIYTGLISVTISFFVLEFVLQRRVVPFMFPDGGLSMTPGTLRIRIRTRLIALLFAINIVPLLAVFGDVAKLLPVGAEAQQALTQLKSIIFIQIVLFICCGIWLVFLVSSNLTKSLKEIIVVLQRIKKGDYQQKVRVTSNDEIGYTGDVINKMTTGLLDRERMQQSLNLAREVQQNLLPSENLSINGIEIAGKSLYCDETGGDYYDFIPIGNGAANKIGIAIGDVSGHGISSALLMTTVRSYLRLRASLPGSAAQIITAVNRQLARDVEDSGQFMTLFFMILDLDSHDLDWVRAGHDPAIVFHSGSDSFDQLDGRGLALGIDGELVYEDNDKASFSKEQIIFLSTDGVWEIRNQAGEMLGKKAVVELIREHSASSAAEILDALLGRLTTFTRGASLEDDITMVIVKARDLSQSPLKM